MSNLRTGNYYDLEYLHIPIENKPILRQRFLNELSEFFEFDIRDKKRVQHLVWARYGYFLICVQNTGHSLAEIGKLVGCDHATVIAGLKTTKNLYPVDKHFRASINSIILFFNKYYGI